MQRLMGFLSRGKKEQDEKKCKVCGLELSTPERLERHTKKAHGNVPEKKVDPKSGDGGMW